MIKDTVSIVLTGKELSIYVSNLIANLEKKWKIQKERAEEFDAKYTTAFYWSDSAVRVDWSFIKQISKEQTFLKLLQKFPENKHELFLDDIEYYGILDDK